MENNNSTGNISGFSEFSNKFIPEIDGFINSYFENKISNAEFPFMKEMYYDLNKYCTRKGKRLRPLLMLLSYAGYKKGKRGINEIIKLASVIEMMHSFLLIQDDIIDKSIMRRGEKALHILAAERYGAVSFNKDIGNDIGIVLADVLFSNSLEIISDAKIDLEIKNRFLKLFSKTYEMTAWGQILDSLNTMARRVDPKSPLAIHASILKTAYYTVYYPILMGFVLSGRKSLKEEKIIKDFSLPLGLAFQIRDDILDLFGDKYITGKTANSDIYESKMTLLIRDTINALDKTERKRFISLFQKKNKKSADVKVIVKIIKKSGAHEIIKARHKELIDEKEKKNCFDEY